MFDKEENYVKTLSSSSSMDIRDNSDVLKVKSYVKELLKSRIFLGDYVERRLLSQYSTYRDIIQISPAEIGFKKDLLEAEMKLRSVFSNKCWIGITNADILGNSSGVCIWTEIEDQPLGMFWLQIRSVKFRENEIMLTVKCIRYISDIFSELEPLFVKSQKNNVECKENKLDDNITSLSESCNEAIQSIRGALSINNIADFVKFLFALFIAFFTGSTTFVNFLGNFVLALIREISILIKNSTPMFLGILDFLGKIVGGFYILLAMMFKPNTPARNNRRTLAYTNQPYYNQYNSKEFD